MSGPIRGKIECAISAINRQDSTQVFFKNIYDYFSSHPNYAVIALQYGLTGSNLPGSTSSGTGTGYYDQANSFGYNAFFVVRGAATVARPFDVYYLFQWGGSVNQAGGNQALGATIGPGNPALEQGSQAIDGNHTSLCVQVAIGIGGTGGTGLSPNNGNPWKGTTNGNGLDLKPSAGPIWGAPAGGGTGVMIFPRSNDGAAGSSSQAGAHVSRTQNGGRVYSASSDTNPVRMNIVGDDDSVCIFADFSDNGNYYFPLYAGLYVPRPNVSQNIPYPFCCIMTWDNIPLSYADQAVYGEIAGTQNRQGGICSTTSGTVSQMQLDHWGNNFCVDTNFNPDHQVPGSPYNEYPIMCGIFENNPVQLSGYLGQITFIREMFNIPTNDTKSDFSRIVLGSTTLAQSKVSVPWDAQTSTVPRSGATRAGVTFVVNNGGGGF